MMSDSKFHIDDKIVLIKPLSHGLPKGSEGIVRYELNYWMPDKATHMYAIEFEKSFAGACNCVTRDQKGWHHAAVPSGLGAWIYESYMKISNSPPNDGVDNWI